MIPIHVIGIGLDGAVGLSETIRQLIEQATLLVGSSRHLSYFPNHSGNRLLLNNFTAAIAQIRQLLEQAKGSAFTLHSLSPTPYPPPSTPHIAILTSGDPLFFGLGRLLLEEFPAEQLIFHPHLSSIQLAFSRIKLPWHDVRFVSAHGRSLDELTQALHQGAEKIAVLTDGTNTPGAIADLVRALDLPVCYKFWVCENLGGANERIVEASHPHMLQSQEFAPLNVVILQRLATSERSLDLTALPLLGIPDQAFLSFSDRPRLMTKREVRVQILGELALQPSQIVWDIGAGTGSISIEIARLCPASKVYAVEKTAIGSALIEKNCLRFQVNNVISIHGTAPETLETLPQPNRIFIGGSGGHLTPILDFCGERLASGGRIVLALATLEHQSEALHWFAEQVEEGGGKWTRAEVDENRSKREQGRYKEASNSEGYPFQGRAKWHYRLLQLQISRSLPVASLTRLSPLNPVLLLVAEKIH
ncbi:precorrin-6y C5,15-methyltransferase (decarboxylating) subunit CbiE [Leptothermofonsia sp. ETS-13]|uniref:precorrin-6y C5,15-methyltransferase (decarboxylating) subunit CbiE n=1 Tax=Leptothermofonsia sp. ETS-13 TaxID=3035696 RepID=UPI003B9EC448